jgi:uncharacterized protein
MQSGQIEANLLTLNDEFRLPYARDLVDRKIHGREQSTLASAETEFH